MVIPLRILIMNSWEQVTSSQVNTASVGGQPRMVYFQMNNHLMKFKIHSSADVTLIIEANYLEARDGIL